MNQSEAAAYVEFVDKVETALDRLRPRHPSAPYKTDYVKVREVAGSVVVTIPRSVLSWMDLRPGDPVVVEATAPNKVTITKA